jgi:hypothetical protein
MIELGAVLTIGHILKQTDDFIQKYRSAPSEFCAAKTHVIVTVVALNSIKSQLQKHRKAMLRKPAALQSLDEILKQCKTHLKTLQQLLNDYRQRPFGWATRGGAKVAKCRTNLSDINTALNTWLGAQSFGAAIQVDDLIRRLEQHGIANSDIQDVVKSTTGSLRLKKGIHASQFITRMKHDVALKKGNNHTGLPRPGLTRRHSSRLAGRTNGSGRYVLEYWHVTRYKPRTSSWKSVTTQLPMEQFQLQELSRSFQNVSNQTRSRNISKEDDTVKYLLSKKAPVRWEFESGKVTREVGLLGKSHRETRVIIRRFTWN